MSEDCRRVYIVTYMMMQCDFSLNNKQSQMQQKIGEDSFLLLAYPSSKTLQKQGHQKHY